MSFLDGTQGILDPANELRLDLLRSFPANQSVLSVYLPLDPRHVAQRGYVPALMNAISSARDAVLPEESDRFEPEADRVLKFVREDFEPRGRTLVVFACLGNETFETLSLRSLLPVLVRFGRSPYLRPLEAALENDPRIAVAVVDEHEARLMTSFLSEIEFKKRVVDPVPGRQRQGGWSAFRYERDRAHHVEEHLRHVANLLQDLAKALPYKKLVLGGTPETLSGLKEHLTPDLKAILAGSFPAEMFAPDDELLLTGLAIAEASEREDELALVERIRDTALDGRRASLGLEETFQMLAEGRVHQLALSESTIGTPVGDKALELAWDSGASVEFLQGEAEAALKDNGGIGALLRY